MKFLAGLGDLIVFLIVIGGTALFVGALAALVVDSFTVFCGILDCV
jgi:hypothetical protein